MNIDLLTTIFAVASIVIVVGVLYQWRRVPIVRMIRAAERRTEVHRQALAGLEQVMDDARARGDTALLEQLAVRYRFHRRTLIALDPKATLRSGPEVVDLRKAA